MTLRITVKNEEDTSSPHNVRVHEVLFDATGIHAQDGHILKPGEEMTFTIYGTLNDPVQKRLAIEEEYSTELTFVTDENPVL
jgi:hypothetical protein